MGKAKQDQKLDKDLADSFPASDPTPGNVFVGAPSQHTCHDKECEDEKLKSRDDVQ